MIHDWKIGDWCITPGIDGICLIIGIYDNKVWLKSNGAWLTDSVNAIQPVNKLNSIKYEIELEIKSSLFAIARLSNEGKLYSISRYTDNIMDKIDQLIHERNKTL